MYSIDVTKTQFRVTDFVNWQRDRTLDLHPEFQRRSVWKPGAKSYFIDTVCRGLPAPVIYIRESLDLEKQTTRREVVDGQQRLRTLFAYIDPKLLADFEESRDRFTVKAVHNEDLAGKTFGSLNAEMKKRILSYEFSTHVLPLQAEDRQVLQMFARLNATGVKLNSQELRNAEYFGAFKTLMYELALEQLDRWRAWNIFTYDSIARMSEVELVSDLVINMLDGIHGKDQRLIDRFYSDFDDSFAPSTVVARRFRRVTDIIDECFGENIAVSAFHSQVMFFSLFVFLYDTMYGLKSRLTAVSPRPIAGRIAKLLPTISQRILEQTAPIEVLDAIRRAPTDLGRRTTRHAFLSKAYAASS